MDVQPSFRHQSGFSMIEVLIAVLILSFGISSIGMMMLATMQNTRGAILRSRAVTLVQDMAERIRANPEARSLYDTNATTPADHTCFPVAAAAGTTCSAEDLAEHDLYHWRELIADTTRGLPQGSGSVVRDATLSPPQYTVTITWKEGQTSDGTAFEQKLAMKVRL